MAKNITIRVPGKHPQTGELTTFELKGQRMDIDIGGQAVPFLIHGRGIGTSLTHIPSGYRIALLGGRLGGVGDGVAHFGRAQLFHAGNQKAHFAGF